MLTVAHVGRNCLDSWVRSAVTVARMAVSADAAAGVQAAAPLVQTDKVCLQSFLEGAFRLLGKFIDWRLCWSVLSVSLL